MAGPKHQHFIPRSYLKNFALLKNETYFVEAKLKSEEKPKSDLMAISNICVNKNLYTMPWDKNDKYKLEKYYATDVDGVYPEVYELLVNPKVVDISIDQRWKIIFTTMSLYFRTPHFLKYNQRRSDIIIDYGVRNHCKDDRVKFQFKEITFDFHLDELETVKQQLRVDLKIQFLIRHLDDWSQFVKHKLLAGISVLRIAEDVDLISSDNPIVISKPFHQLTDIFDPENVISFTIDPKHYVQIMPNTVGSMNRIVRDDRDLTFAIAKNHSLEEQSEDWIYGLPGSITKHIADQIKYNELTEDNFRKVDEAKERYEDAKKLVELLERHGSHDPRVIQQAKDMLKKDIHKHDVGLRKIIEASI